MFGIFAGELLANYHLVDLMIIKIATDSVCVNYLINK